MIGFAQDESIKLGDWQIRCDNPFAVILITDLSKQGDLTTADAILITAVARARNTGMTYDYQDDTTFLTDQGHMPLLLEPVKATISFQGEKKFDIFVLDHDGVKTAQSVPVEDSVFQIDGEKFKTMYYLIETE